LSDLRCHAQAHSIMGRRNFLKAAAAGFGGAFISFGGAVAADRTRVRVQYDWLMGNGQLGDIVAKSKGFFEEQGLDVTFGPGGPNAQTLPPVLTGQARLGQLTSTTDLFLANGAGRPVRLVASGYRYSPYSYISLKKNPVRSAQDLIGKTIAINPNGRRTLDLVLAKNKIDPSQVRTITMGADMTPLISGQADAVSGFITNTKAMSVLGSDIVTFSPAKEGGVPNYANAYFTAADDFDNKKELLARFIRGVAKGWGWAFENRREAVDLMIAAYPTLDREIEYRTVDLIMELSFDQDTKANGWGWHSRDKLASQLELFASVGMFKERVPVLEQCVSWDILDLTADARPKLG
jgi:NitT/TauT family transport system substrate-binding protein